MTHTPNEQQAAFQISSSAAKRLCFLAKQEKDPDVALRISVLGGGCSGFQYQYDFVNEKNAEDVVVEKEGATVVIDPTSLEFLKDSMLDYVETLGHAAFEIKNPNATAKCGCGNSFAV